MVRVAIVAPTLTVRIGLRTLLGSDERLEIVGEGVSLEDAASFGKHDTLSAEADVVILAGLSLSAQDLDDLASEALSHPAVLLIGDAPDEARKLVELPLRAWGILSPDVQPDELVASVHALAEGLVVATPAVLKKMIRPAATQTFNLEPLVDTLTARETEVLQLMGVGYANKQIAAALGISEHTVKFHISSVFNKLDVSSRIEAVRVGIQRGLVVL